MLDYGLVEFKNVAIKPLSRVCRDRRCSRGCMNRSECRTHELYNLLYCSFRIVSSPENMVIARRTRMI